MASEQPTQGIKEFSSALTELEALLADRLSALGENTHSVLSEV